MSVNDNEGGNEFSQNHPAVISPPFAVNNHIPTCPPLPPSSILLPSASGFAHVLPPQPYCISSHPYSRTHPTPVPLVSCHVDSLPTHFNTIYSSGHPAGLSVPLVQHNHPGVGPHLMQHPNSNHFMNQIHTKEALLISQSSEGLQTHNPVFIKQEGGLFPREIPFIKQELGVMPGSTPFNSQGLECVPSGAPFIKQEYGSTPVIKHEPGTIPPFVKQEPRYTSHQEPGYTPGAAPFFKAESGVHSNLCQYSSSTHHGTGLEFGVSFPSQPLNLNFMADIEDILQPSLPSEVTVNSIKSELSSFDGPSSHRPARHRVGMVKEESEEPPWEPALWQQQYENIRTMRSKRDAPVDKFGCFMNAEKEVLPEVRRYQVLISLMLSSQTKDEVVSKAMTKLKENGLTISNVINTPQEEIARMIFPVGFWNKKGEYIKRTTKILEEKFNSDIPNSVEGLVSLPGIGPKMAHLIMDFAWGQVSGIAVDTHVHRITHRLGWMRRETRNPEEARKSLEKWIPKSEWSDLNLLFVGLGQQICTPVSPKCCECLNKALCPSSSCLVPSGLPLGIGFEVSTKSKGKKAKSSPMQGKGASKRIKIEQ